MIIASLASSPSPSIPPTSGDQPARNRKGSNRFIEIDGLRGLFLLLMTFNHLLLWPFHHLGEVLAFSYQPIGFISVAEGFFFISGLVAAMAYGRIYEKGGLKAVLPPLWRRIAKIYVVNSLGAMIIVSMVLVGKGLTQHNAALVVGIREHPWFAVLAPFSLANLPWLTDILSLYVVFLALVPIILVAEYSGHGRWIVAALLVLWSVGQKHPFDALAREFMRQLPTGWYLTFGWFDPAAWLLLFGGAFLISLRTIRGRLPRILATPPKELVFACAAIATFFLFVRHGSSPMSSSAMARWLGVRVMAPLRVLNFGSVAVLIRASWPRLAPILRWRPLTQVGEASLSVFVYHVVLVYACAWLVPDGSPWIVVAVLLGTWPVARFALSFRRLRRDAGLLW